MSYEQEKLDILRDLLGPYSKRGNEYLFHCFKCGHHKKKLSLNLEKDKGKCWTCDYHVGHLNVLVRHVNPSLLSSWRQYDNQAPSIDFSKTERLKKEVIELPPYYRFCLNLSQNHPANQYLKSRGITQKDIINHRIGFCYSGKYRDRVIFPYFNLQGSCHFFTGRVIQKRGLSYLKCDSNFNDIILNELFIDPGKPITLVEGPIDQIKTRDNNCVPLLGSSLSCDGALFQFIVSLNQRIFLALDPDASRKEYSIAEELCLYGADVWKVPVRPFKDIGEMTYEQYLEQKENAHPFCSNDIRNRIRMMVCYC